MSWPARDCNYVINGRFEDDQQWSFAGGAEYVPSVGAVTPEGVATFGSARLFGAGQSVAQANIFLPRCPNFTLEFAHRAAGNGSIRLTLVNDAGQVIYDNTLPITGDGSTWTTWQSKFGFATDSYTLTFSYVNVAFYIDNVSMAHIPKTKLELAQETANNLGTELTVGVAPPVSETDLGGYTEAVDRGLRWLGAVNCYDEADTRCLLPERVADCLDRIEEVMATGPVLNYFQTLTDTTLGPRSERFSQISRSIREQYGLVAGAEKTEKRRFSTVKMVHPRYTLRRDV